MRKKILNKNIYAFEVKKINDDPLNLSSFRGRVLLIVNVASECGFTSQYSELQKLYDKYQEQEFSILAFPCNDFGTQEPGSNTEIKDFCLKKFQLTFDLFSKVSILGPDKTPLYKYLLDYGLEHQGVGMRSKILGIVKWILYRIKGMPIPEKHEVQWNFHKFLIGKNGIPVASFLSEVKPDSERLSQKIEEELSK